MRRILLVLLLLTAMVGVRAAGETTLALSKSLMAFRVTNPAKQLDTFSPVLELVDGLIESASQKNPQHPAPATSASEALRHGIAEYANIPGVNTDGDLWFVQMPLTPGQMVPTLEPGREHAPVDPAKQPPSYVLVPLKDPTGFQQFLAAPPKAGEKPAQGIVIGNVGVVALSGPKPAFTNLAMDLPLISHAGVVGSFQISNFDVDSLQANAPPTLMQLLAPLNTLLQEQQQNQQRMEIGLSMDANDLLLETYIVPVPNSPLAKAINAPAGDGLALEYAGYLPDNLAYCGAGGPLMKGAAGVGNNLARVAFGVLQQFMPPENAVAFNASMERNMALCSQGRALGITTPDAHGKGAAFVAVYHTAGEKEARATVQEFVEQLAQSSETVMGGVLSEGLAFSNKPAAETIAGVPVDVITLTVKNIGVTPKAVGGDNTPGAVKPAAPPSLIFETRVAYLGDKMLCAVGDTSKQQIEGMLTRIREKTPGYTASPRFQTLKTTFSPKVRGFETWATLDLTHTVVSLIPGGNGNADMKKFLAIFPPQHTAISSNQEIQNGHLHSVLRVPDEQLRYLYTLLNAAISLAPAKKPVEKPQ